jgi:rhomboid protease GluP
VIRAVSVGMPGKLSVTSVLLGLYVLLQVLPIAVFPNVVKTAGEYVTQGDSNRYLLLHENDKNIYGLDMTGKRRFPVAPGLFIVDTHILMGANHGPLLEQGQYWRLITATFLHLGLMHLLFNGYALFVLGRPTEGLYGWGWFLGLYLASGIGGNLVSWAAGVFDYPNLQLGASGAIFGLIGVGIVHCWRHRWVNRALLNTLLLWGGLSLAMGFFIGADNWAHVGGLLTGAGLAWLLPAERVTRREYTKLGNTVGMVSALLILISVGFAAASAVELVAVIP